MTIRTFLRDSVRHATIVFSVFALAACSGGNSNEPSEDDIGKAIAFDLPGGIEVSEVEIVVSDNEGSAVEPLIKTRTKVTLEFADDFVIEKALYDDKYILQKAFKKGQELEGTVITSARLKGESWAVKIDRFDFPKIQGAALSRYVAGSYAFEGTDAATRFEADYETKLAADEKARQEAADRRQAEIRAATEQAAKEQAARIAAFRGQLAGTWVSKTPLMRNGSIFIANNTRKTAGIELSFPEGNSATGIARASIYVADNPVDAVTVEAGFSVMDDGKSVRLGIKSQSHRTLDFYFSETWVMGADGMFKTTGRDQWYSQLEKDGSALAAKRQLVAKIEARDKAIEKLVVKHSAAVAPDTFSDTRLENNTYFSFFVEAANDPNGRLYGDGRYSYGTSIAKAALHAGLLADGEAGVLKIIKHRGSSSTYPGTIRNGLTSQSFSDNDYYTLELVEKLKAD